jgi:hypothetical protein
VSHGPIKGTGLHIRSIALGLRSSVLEYLRMESGKTEAIAIMVSFVLENVRYSADPEQLRRGR